MEKGVTVKSYSVNNEWFFLCIKWKMYKLKNNQLGCIVQKHRVSATKICSKSEVNNQQEHICENRHSRI